MIIYDDRGYTYLKNSPGSQDMGYEQAPCLSALTCNNRGSDDYVTYLQGFMKIKLKCRGKYFANYNAL